MTKEELVNRLLSIDKQISTRSWITAGGDLGELIDELREEINRGHSLPSNLGEATEKMYPMTTTPPTPIEVAAHYNAAQQKLRDAFKAGA